MYIPLYLWMEFHTFPWVRLDSDLTVRVALDSVLNKKQNMKMKIFLYCNTFAWISTSPQQPGEDWTLSLLHLDPAAYPDPHILRQ